MKKQQSVSDMMETLIDLDKTLFLILNGQHHPWLDPVMYQISQTVTWAPLYVFLLFIVLKKYRNDSWAPLLAIFLTVIIADQSMTAILKPVFQRLRPTREPSIANLVHTVNDYRGGLYGFASSHASNTFGVALLFWFLFRKYSKWILLLFLWAAVVSYSRIYLGVHYPGDILGGIVVGILAAFAGWYLYLFLNKKFMTTKSDVE